jgi:radical SAM superfamily enzyme YgiQ (UPF0313 family)
MGYIAAVLERDGFEVSVIDLNVLRLPLDQEKETLIRSIEDADVVGTGGMITLFETVSRITEIIKKHRPDLPVIVGGPMTSHFQDLILKNSGIDLLVMGEGETTVSAAVDALTGKGNISGLPGIAYLSGRDLVITPPAERIRNLDSLPLPAYHLFPFESYIRNRGVPRTTDIIGSRGCPFKCSFCHRNFGNEVTFRSVDSVIEEIRFLKYFYRIEHIHLEDELFVQRNSYISEFSEKIKQLEISWSACARANTITRDILKKMKSAGCNRLMVGLESFSAEMLKEMNKHNTPEQNHEACRLMREEGIRISPGLIIGMPGETAETVRQTVEGCIRHKILMNEWSYAFATPYPGTALYAYVREKGIVTDDLEYIYRLCRVGDTRDLTVNLTSLTDDELIRLRNEAIKTVRTHVRRPIMEIAEYLLQGSRKSFSEITDSGMFRKARSLAYDLIHTKGTLNAIRKEHFRYGLDGEQARKLFMKAVTMVEVELFSFCNRRCWFCPNTIIDRHSENRFMSEDVYGKILQNLGEISYRGKISYSRYNEPLAHETIFMRLRQAREKLPGALLHLNTNGDYLSKDVLQRLYESGLRSLNLQLYFSDKGGYSDESAVKTLISRIEKLGLRNCYVHSEPGEWLEYELFFRDMVIRAYARNFEKNGVNRGGILETMGNGEIRESPCLEPFFHLYIDYNGSVVPCCNIRSDYAGHNEMVLGNLADVGHDIFSIFASERAVSVRRELIGFGSKQGSCRFCLFQTLPKSSVNLSLSRKMEQYGANRRQAN